MRMRGNDGDGMCVAKERNKNMDKVFERILFMTPDNGC